MNRNATSSQTWHKYNSPVNNSPGSLAGLNVEYSMRDDPVIASRSMR